MSTIGVLVISGSAEFLKVVLSSAKVSNSILTENDFKQTIARGLSIDCAEATPEIRPDNLEGSDKNNGIGDFKSDFTLPGDIKIGTFKGSIEVVKMDLTGDSSKPTRDFNIYYKKVGLERASAPDSQNCIAKNGGTPAKTAGCFKHTCTVGIESSNKSCNGVVNCHNFSENTITEIKKISKQAIANKSCPAHQFFSGFDSNGNKICSPDITCPSGKALSIEKNTDGTITKECISAGGSINPKACPPGKFIRERRANGDFVCESACGAVTGRVLFENLKVENPITYNTRIISYEVGEPVPDYTGETLVSKSRVCKCRDGAHWNGTECVICTGDRKWVQSAKACMECTGGVWSPLLFGSGFRCHCPSGYKKKTLV